MNSGENNNIFAFSIVKINLDNKRRPILGSFYPDRQVRLYKKDKVVYRGLIHEMPAVSGLNYLLPEHYYIIHFHQKFWSRKLADYAYIQKKQCYRFTHVSKLRVALWRLMPLSIIPYYFYILGAFSIRGKKLFNIPALIYSFRTALYDGLLHTLMKIRTRKEKIIAEVISKRGLIQLLGLDS
ncbi:MAG: hypothetical protein NZ893_01755 [Candidatus Aenigmarchaeota archaeon]|nr:hypothetical protein [Candidatus Aenigmarchaeota archaeon]